MSKENLDQDFGPDLQREEMRIGTTICEMHYYTGGTDGVSLQATENQNCLIKNGENVSFCASDVPGLDFSELDYHAEQARLLRETILDPISEVDEDIVLDEITRQSAIIQEKISNYLTTNEVGIVHLRNITSLPFLHLPATKAVHDLVEERQDVGFVLHHHDFTWEGPMAARFSTGYERVNQLAEEVMIPDFSNTKHVVLSSLAAAELKVRRGVEAEVIPDGFNFDRSVTPIDEEAFRKDFGFGENDLLVGMMTRVRINKAIQIALQYVQALEIQRGKLEKSPDGVGMRKKNFGPDSKIFLVLSQSKDLDEEYFKQINEMAETMGVGLRFIGDRIVQDTQYFGEEGTYPFYGVYQPMDIIVYPPIHEGFGNQAIEAAWSRKPLVMHKYPVAESDILPNVKEIIPLGGRSDLRQYGDKGMLFLDDDVVKQSAHDSISVLLDHDLEKSMTDEVYNGFRNLCDINRITERYKQIYKKLLVNKM